MGKFGRMIEIGYFQYCFFGCVVDFWVGLVDCLVYYY